MPTRSRKTSAGVFTLRAADNSLITYELLRSARKTITLRVHPDARVTVDAPRKTPKAEIETFVQRHTDWIIKKQTAVQVAEKPARTYQNGELFPYLGEHYPLEVELDRIERVRLVAGVLTVGVKAASDPSKVRDLLGKWYRRRAELLFPALLAVCYPYVASLERGTMSPPLTIRLMKTRWGSCTRAGRVALNLALIQMPEPIIRYVVIHELCHLVEFNHSTRFWALVGGAVPNYKSLRKRLRDYPTAGFF